MKIFSKEFAVYAGERAIKTFAQTLLALITVDIAINEIDWLGKLAVASTATVASLLTSIIAARGPETTPSLGAPAVNTEEEIIDIPRAKGRHSL
jgi:hypothetical protein